MRALVLAPHPDDEAIGCGGTIAMHVAKGDDVCVVFVTSGERGGGWRAPADTGPLRETEAAAAAGILGVKEIEFWREPDGALTTSGTLTPRLTACVAQRQPDVVYLSHPVDAHPDHRATAAAAERVCSALDDPPVLLAYEIWTPLQCFDEIVDISEVIDVKIAAIRAHASQCEQLRYDEAARALARYRGEMHSWPGGDYAEVFWRLSPRPCTAQAAQIESRVAGSRSL